MTDAPSPAETESAADENPETEAAWGFGARGKNIPRETKIGLALILVLVAALGFVVYTKFSRKEKLAENVETVAPISDSTEETPTPVPGPADAVDDGRPEQASASFDQQTEPSTIDSDATVGGALAMQSEPVPREYEQYAANTLEPQSAGVSNDYGQSEFAPAQSSPQPSQDFTSPWETGEMTAAEPDAADAFAPEAEPAAADADPFDPFGGAAAAGTASAPPAADAQFGNSSEPATSTEGDFGLEPADADPFAGNSMVADGGASDSQLPPQQNEPGQVDQMTSPAVDGDPFAAGFDEPATEPVEVAQSESDDFGSAASIGVEPGAFSPSSLESNELDTTSQFQEPGEFLANGPVEPTGRPTSEPPVELSEIEPVPRTSTQSMAPEAAETDDFGAFVASETETQQAGSTTTVSRADSEPAFDASMDESQEFVQPVPASDDFAQFEPAAAEPPTASEPETEPFGFEDQFAGQQMTADSSTSSEAAFAEPEPQGLPSEFQPQNPAPLAATDSNAQFEPPVFREPQESAPITSSPEGFTAANDAIPPTTAGQSGGNANAAENDSYTVQENDNYWKISQKRYGTARYFQALALYNKPRVPDPTKMRPGTSILTPPREVLESQFPQLFPKQKPAGQQTAFRADASTPVSASQPSGYFIDRSGRPMYRVGADDTLTDISQNHLGRSSRWKQIYAMNRDRLQDPNKLQVGTVLRLPFDASRGQIVRNMDFSDKR